MSDPLLSVKNLQVYFPTRNGPYSRAVDGISFDVGEGETVCIVGESGSGKTVTALTILGLIPSPPAFIHGGEILFMGRSILGLEEEEMRSIRGREISMVFQEPLTSLNPVFTIGYQIKEAIFVHKRLGEAALDRRTVDLLHAVGIPSPEHRMKDYPHQLSGGQRQRVMIAMALACDPRLMIADEPTTALDVTVQAQILGLFRRLKEERSLSLLYITHDLGVVANVADRVFVVYAGTVVEQGRATDIFETPLHPYTTGLLSSIPDRTRRGKRLYSIPGMVPDPSNKPGGCPFHPRCPKAIEECSMQFPERMVDYGNGHCCRCHVMERDHLFRSNRH